MRQYLWLWKAAVKTCRMDEIIEALREAKACLEAFISDEAALKNVALAADIMSAAIAGGGKIIAVGNGGSLCDATHFCEELTARFRRDRRALAAIAANDAAFITCAANDFDPKDIFKRYVEALGRGGDVLLAISTSGNSENVLRAAKEAGALGMKVVALTGKDGGQLGRFADVEIRAPQSRYSDRAQEIHIKVIHILVQEIEKKVIYGGKENV